MTVGELRALLSASSLPYSAEVFVPGRHSLHVCRAEAMTVSLINQYGQAHHEVDGDPALVFTDCSDGATC